MHETLKDGQQELTQPAKPESTERKQMQALAKGILDQLNRCLIENRSTGYFAFYEILPEYTNIARIAKCNELSYEEKKSFFDRLLEIVRIAYQETRIELFNYDSSDDDSSDDDSSDEDSLKKNIPVKQEDCEIVRMIFDHILSLINYI